MKRKILWHVFVGSVKEKETGKQGNKNSYTSRPYCIWDDQEDRRLQLTGQWTLSLVESESTIKRGNGRERRKKEPSNNIPFGMWWCGEKKRGVSFSLDGETNWKLRAANRENWKIGYVTRWNYYLTIQIIIILCVFVASNNKVENKTHCCKNQ